MSQVPNVATGETAPPSDDFFHQYLHRTIALLGQDAVDTLRTKTIAVSGCGGHGGAAAITLARMGVAGFILADPNPFDEPDINRQWGATCATLGRNKARVYEEILCSINPDCRVRVFEDGVTAVNVPEFLEGADLLIDCLDIAVPGTLRAQLFREARTRGIHASTGANLGFGGMVASASPDGWPLEILEGVEDNAISSSQLPSLFYGIFVPEYLRQVEQSLCQYRVPSIAVAPVLLGALLSVEALAALLGGVIPGWRPPVCLPQVLLVDLLRMNYRVVHLDDLATQRAPTAASATPGPAQGAVATAAIRQSQLTQVGCNTNLLPDGAIEVVLVTDSWSEIPLTPSQPDAADQWIAAPQEVLRGLYGYKYVMPVFRGRFAVLLQQREEGLRDKPLVAIVRDLCACSDCCASSCTKDFKTPIGGFTATREAAHATLLRDLALATGDGLSTETKGVLGRTLAHHAVWAERCRDRVGLVQRLWGQLRALGVPVVGPAGGHGVFVDAQALLPQLAPGQYPAQALANALYLRAGVRGAVNFQTPQQARDGAQLLRLAVPIVRYTEAQLAVMVDGFRGLMAEAATIHGLRKTYSPPGAIGEFAASFQTVAPG